MSNSTQSIHPNAETITAALSSLLTTGDRKAFESLPKETQAALMGQSKLVAMALYEPAMFHPEHKESSHA